jgi:hypothetical protein
MIVFVPFYLMTYGPTNFTFDEMHEGVLDALRRRVPLTEPDRRRTV